MEPIRKNSRDYLYLPLRARSRGRVVEQVAVRVAFTREGQVVQPQDWRPAEYTTPYVRYLMQGDLDVGTWVVSVQLVDVPTMPELRAGTIDVVDL